MSFSFRKSFKVAPGLRLNFSKRSAGLSVGPCGFKLSANTRGKRRASAGAKGFRWTKLFADREAVTKRPRLRGLQERMMGLEPTTFCWQGGPGCGAVQPPATEMRWLCGEGFLLRR